MPSLKQATILAYKYLKNCLKPYRYFPVPGITIQKYNKFLIVFCLCIDDFRIKYQSKLDTDYLYNSVGANFRYTVDKEEKNYYNLTLEWNYKLRYINASILKYILKIL